MISVAHETVDMRIVEERPSGTSHGIPVVALGMAVSGFLVISYVLCILGYLVWPELPIQHAALGIFLPGFALLSWPTFFLGLVESVFWGWYIAVVFGVLFNFCVRRFPGALG